MSGSVETLREELASAHDTIAELRGQLAACEVNRQQGRHDLDDSRRALLFMLEDLESARKKIELAHLQWMTALDAIEDPIFLHDKEFRILRANRAYQQCAGIPYTELLGKPYFEIFPKMDGPLPGCLHAMGCGEWAVDEFVQGDTIYSGRSRPVCTESGEYQLSVHSLQDVTRRKQDERRLRESEQRYRTLFETMLNGFAYCRMLYENGIPSDFVYLDVNAAFEQQTGLKNVAGKRVSEVIPGIRESDPQLFERYGRVAAGGAPEQFEIYVEALKMWFFISVYSPEPQHFVAVFDVITARKLAQQALENEALRRRLLMQASRDGIAIIDQQHRVVEANARFAEMLGYTPDEMLELHTWDFEANMSEAEIRAGFTDLSIANTTLETRHRRKDGTLYDAEVSIGGSKVGGEPMVFTVSRDISERKQHERAMHRANRALRTISAGNQVLIHAQDEAQLLREMCGVAVQIGGYQMAWIGYARDDAEKSVEHMAHACLKAHCPKLLPLTWNETQREICPAGRAIISGQHRVVEDIAADPEANPWREEAVRCNFASYIALPLKDGARTFGALVLFDDKANSFDADEVTLLEEMAGDLAFGILTSRVKKAHRENEQRLQQNMLQTVKAIAGIVEMRDPYTSGHQVRVAEVARAIAGQMGMPDEQVQAIYLAGLLHDLGKISIPAEILSKPGRLNAIEYSLIKMHPQSGYDILKDIDFAWPIAQMVLQHHEHLDGSGYPQGLRDGEILIGARILSVADVVEAMSSHRPYRPGLGINAALDEIVRARGTHYDPQVVDACMALFKENNYVIPK